MGYRRTASHWVCTALEFDLVGIGSTQRKAFTELQGVVDTYLTEILNTAEDVNFFNPSEPDEWERARRKEEYLVIAVLAETEEPPTAPYRFRNIRELRPVRDSVRAFRLAPVGG